MRPTTPNFNFSHQAGPSSPPQTPTTPQFHYRQYKTRRNGMLFSPPTATETPVANPIDVPREHRQPSSSPFYANYTELSPRSSSPTSSTHSSDLSTSPPPRSISSSPGAPLSSSPPFQQKTRIISLMKANFTIEEFRDSEYEDFDSDDGSIIRPSQYEDAESERGDNHTHTNGTVGIVGVINPIPATHRHQSSPAQAPVIQKPIDPKILHTLTSLRCSDSEGEGEDEGYLHHQAWVEHQRREKRRKRRSSSSFKRNFAQSIGSDTDEEDLLPQGPLDANDAGSSARRLRRRTTERASLIFDDPPARIDELEEPESCEELVEVPEDEVREQMARNLPYWIQEDMEIDSSSEEEDSDDD